MCHLILLLPIIVLPVWWLLPPIEAATVYAVVLLASIMVYRLAVQAMHAPVLTGTAPLLGATGNVRRAEGWDGTVWIASELWSATSLDGALVVGDEIEVVGIDGLTLRVRKPGTPGNARRSADPVHA